MGEKLEKILSGIAFLGVVTLLGWMGYDSIKARVEIEKEAQKRGISVYDVCKQNGRSDVIDMIEIEEGLNNIRGYVWAGDLAIPFCNPELKAR